MNEVRARASESEFLCRHVFSELFPSHARRVIDACELNMRGRYRDSRISRQRTKTENTFFKHNPVEGFRRPLAFRRARAHAHARIIMDAAIRRISEIHRWDRIKI